MIVEADSFCIKTTQRVTEGLPISLKNFLEALLDGVVKKNHRNFGPGRGVGFCNFRAIAIFWSNSSNLKARILRLINLGMNLFCVVL